MKKSLIVIVAALSAAACVNSETRYSELKPGSSYWLTYPADRRGTLVISRDGRFASCAEPPPDIAKELKELYEGSTKVNIAGSGGEASGKSNRDESVKLLTQRTPALLFFREAAFRLCEQSMNGTMDAAATATAFNNIVHEYYRLSGGSFDTAQPSGSTLPAAAPTSTKTP